MRDEPKPLTHLKHDVPAEVRQIVKRCLNKDPAARYASGAELAHELKSCRDLLFPESGGTLRPARLIREVRRPRMLIPILLAVALIAAGIVWLSKRSRDIRWAHDVAVPEISQLSDQGKFGAAYALATRAEKLIPGDPVLEKLWPAISYQTSIETTPPGVEVYRRDYADATAPWERVGKTPLTNLRQPRGMFLWKFEKPGFGTVLRTTSALLGWYPPPPGRPVSGS